MIKFGNIGLTETIYVNGCMTSQNYLSTFCDRPMLLFTRWNWSTLWDRR